MKGPLQDYFDFSRKEQLGLMMLIGIILACIVLMNFHHVFFPLEPIDVSEKERALMTAIQTEREQKLNEYKSQAKADNKKGPRKKRLADPFEFDPNTLDKEGYMRLGFSEKQAKSILNYFSRGGRVRKLEDFKKIYVVNDFMFERLEPFIRISEIQPLLSQDRSTKLEVQFESPDSKVVATERRSKEILKVDINTADHEQLMSLRGIGPKYAERIIKYRNLLGGFRSLNQLEEIYGLKEHPEIIEDLKGHMILSEFHLQKVEINTCEWKDLVRNPYIEKEVANSILAIRKTHGEYRSVEDIMRSHLIDEELYHKISPYLTVDSR